MDNVTTLTPDLSGLTREELEQGTLSMMQQVNILQAGLAQAQAVHIQVVSLLMGAIATVGNEIEISQSLLNLGTTYALETEPVMQSVLLPGQSEPAMTALRVKLVPLPVSEEEEGNEDE